MLWVPTLIPNVPEISVPPPAPDGAAVRAVRAWAQHMLAPDTAVIVDTETSDFTHNARIVELAVIDAATAHPLLVSLVNPEAPIAAEATAVHGITDRQIAAAPTWSDLLPQLVSSIGDRRILAYNADFDRGRVLASHGDQALTAELGHPYRWGCLMHARSVWTGTNHRLPLNGPHRGLGDVHAAREVLVAIAGRMGRPPLPAAE